MKGVALFRRVYIINPSYTDREAYSWIKESRMNCEAECICIGAVGVSVDW